MHINSASIDQMLGDIIPRHFGPLRNSRKILARATGASPLTVRNWLEMKCFPQAFHFVRLMIAFPALRAEVNAIIEREARDCTEQS